MQSPSHAASSVLSPDGRYRIDVRLYPPMQQGDSTEEGQLLVDVATGEVILEARNIQGNAQLVFGPNELVTLRVPGWRRQLWLYLLDPARKLVANGASPTDWRPLAELPAMVRAPSAAESEANLVEWRAKQLELAKLRRLLVICAIGALICGAVTFLPTQIPWPVRASAGIGLLLFAFYLVLAVYDLVGRK